jgi:hypothetical protein
MCAADWQCEISTIVNRAPIDRWNIQGRLDFFAASQADLAS